MSLKKDRQIVETSIDFFMNEAATRGVIVVHSTSGSGVSLDDTNAKVITPGATVSGTDPAGLLLNDVVDIDLTRQHINFYKDEVIKGSKVTLLRKGTVSTSNVSGTPTAGDSAYYNDAGEVTPVAVANSTKVGRFLSAKDADGYAKIDVNIV